MGVRGGILLTFQESILDALSLSQIHFPIFALMFGTLMEIETSYKYICFIDGFTYGWGEGRAQMMWVDSDVKTWAWLKTISCQSTAT